MNGLQRSVAAAGLMLMALAGGVQAATIDEALGLYKDKHYAEALGVAKGLAANGDVKAMVLLGTMYENGQGTEESAESAREWFGKAAEAGDADAQYEYAMLLLDENAGDVDPASAASWLAKAAGNGNDKAQYNLALIYSGQYGADPDWPKAVEWFGKSAAAGNPKAQYNLGLLYLDGKGVTANPVAAAEWLSKAALKGMPEAALEYGVLVIRGEGVERNVDIGVRWLRYAAEHGHPVAQNRLARIYAAGTGVASDPVEAAMWNILAEKGGRSDPDLDDFMKQLTAEQRAEAEKRVGAFVAKPSPDFD